MPGKTSCGNTEGPGLSSALRPAKVCVHAFGLWTPMRHIRFYFSLRAIGWLVLALMLAALVYSVVMSIHYWSGIGV